MDSDESVDLAPRQKRQAIRYGKRTRAIVTPLHRIGTKFEPIVAQFGKRKRGIVEDVQISTDDDGMEEPNGARDVQDHFTSKSNQASGHVVMIRNEQKPISFLGLII